MFLPKMMKIFYLLFVGMFIRTFSAENLCNKSTDGTYLTQSNINTDSLINIQIESRAWYNKEKYYGPYSLSLTWRMSFDLFLVSTTSTGGDKYLFEIRENDNRFQKLEFFLHQRDGKLHVCNSISNTHIRIPITYSAWQSFTVKVNNENNVIITTGDDIYQLDRINNTQKIKIHLGEGHHQSIRKTMIRNLKIINKAYPVSPFFGRVVYKGSMFTRNNWSPNNSKVICSVLCGQNLIQTFTYASVINHTIFPSFRESLRLMNSPSCIGEEEAITKCNRFSSIDNIQNQETAAVHCLTNLNTLDFQLFGNGENATGLVYLSNVPVCMDKSYWKFNAKFICNAQYQIAYGDAVEVTHITKEGFFISDLTCNWDDLLSNHKNCSSSVLKGCKNLIGVKCAKCNSSILLTILTSIKTEGSEESIISSIEIAKSDLLNKCQKWDCYGNNSQQYPDYCIVYNFLSDMDSLINKDIVKNNNEYWRSRLNSIQISSFPIQFDILKHHFFEERFSKLSSDIKVMSFELASSIAGYFSQMAQFDSSIAASDLAYAISVWEISNEAVLSKQKTVSNQLKTILEYVNSNFKIDIVENIFVKAFNILLDPMILFSKFDLSDVLNIFKDLAIIFQTKTELNTQQIKFNSLISITTKINDNIKINRNSYETIFTIINKAKINKKLSLDEARRFLQEYDSFSPAIKKDEIETYASVIEHILESLCAYIDSQTGAFSTIISALSNAKQICPEIKSNMAVIHALYEEIENQQFEIMTAFARSARSIISEEGAKQIFLTVSKNKTGVELEIIKIRSILMIRQNKVSLIKKACNQLTYMNHGNAETICTNLLNNFDDDIGPLIYSPLGKTSMCSCPNCQTKEGVFLIPARRNSSDTSINEINLDRLYNSSNLIKNDGVYFRIPDLQWLRNNKWISDFDTGPFFLQKLTIYLPPQSKKIHEYQLNVQLVDTKLGIHNITFQDGLKIENHITVNPLRSHCKDAIENPYFFENNNMGKICINVDGTINGLTFPSLVGSTWKITLLSESPLRKLYPANDFFIKAQAKFCYTASTSHSSENITRNESHTSKDLVGDASHASGDSVSDEVVLLEVLTTGGEKKKQDFCPENQYFDILQALSSKNDDFEAVSNICKHCPVFSKPRLFGYICEQCPKGFTTSKNGYYGCDPCDVDYFKNEIGPDKCLKCPTNFNTNKKKGFSRCLSNTTFYPI